LVVNRLTTRLYRLAADLAVAIDLPAAGRVVLTWDELGDRQTLTLPRPSDSNDTTYTISLLNNPPISSPEDHDEMYLYYKVLEADGDPIPKSSRRQLNFVSNDPTTDEIPCSPVLLVP
jgi:hypothetical protein